jgi:16S rRNA (cytosine1402-N4)-methyltransferase
MAAAMCVRPNIFRIQAQFLHSKQNQSIITNHSTISSIKDVEYHKPVMKAECLHYLDIQPGRVYVDCTLGGGGHSLAILQKGGLVIGIDQDKDAIIKAQSVCEDYIKSGAMEIHHANFRQINQVIANSMLLQQQLQKQKNLQSNSKSASASSGTHACVDGVLMDLGVSSYQIDEASRGFAFSQEGPLDMRMYRNTTTSNSVNDLDLATETEILTAADIVNTYNTKDLADIFLKYGDETNSKAISRQIVLNRPLYTTTNLEQIISSVTPWKRRAATLARCFQALRIIVNKEMLVLDEALTKMHEIIKPGGRLVVMSYHSLEDRRIKNCLRNQLKMTNDNVNVNVNYNDNDGEGDVYDDSVEIKKKKKGKKGSKKNNNHVWELLMKKCICPTEEEIKQNSRARSAKLRAAIKR